MCPEAMMSPLFIKMDRTVIVLNTPEALDSLQEVLKRGAQALLRHAVESELESRLTEHFALKTEDGRYKPWFVMSIYLSAPFRQGLVALPLKFLM